MNQAFSKPFPSQAARPLAARSPWLHSFRHTEIPTTGMIRPRPAAYMVVSPLMVLIGKLLLLLLLLLLMCHNVPRSNVWLLYLSARCVCAPVLFLQRITRGHRPLSKTREEANVTPLQHGGHTLTHCYRCCYTT
ncbi:unnamed protein product, partial [Ectocarpus fasciculatus]